MYCATLYLFFIEMMPGRIGWKSIAITLCACLVELCGNLLRLHCMPAGGIRLVELGGRSGWKSIEITLYACLVELGGNLLRLHCMPAW